MASIHSRSWIARAFVGLACLVSASDGLKAQLAAAPPVLQHDSRIFGILPNYRTVGTSQNVKPLSSEEKWRLATAEAFDPAAFLVAGVFAGVGQAEHQFPSWGQGAKGLGRRYEAAFADQAVGDYLTGAAFPILFREDPRYFRMGHGAFVRRMGYALGRIAVTRTDAGSNQANYSEFLGNAVAAGIANAYNPAEERTFGNTVQKFGTQLATDALFNVLKEYWPDIHRKLLQRSERGRLQRPSVRQNPGSSVSEETSTYESRSSQRNHVPDQGYGSELAKR